MVKPQILPDGTTFWDFGVYNDNDGYYKKYRSKDCEENAMYLMKAHAPENTEAYTATQTALTTGKLKFLINERDAKEKLLASGIGKNMTSNKRNEYLRPYVLTGMLKEEMIRLKQENEGVNIILKMPSKRQTKDKFSALVYGMYYIKIEEDSKRKKRGRNFAEWRFFN